MNGILGMLGILRDTKLTNEQRESIDVISSCSNTLLNTLNDVLDLTKVEAGKLSITFTDFNFIKMLESTVKIVEPLTKEKGLKLELKIDKGVPERINADPNRIQQIIINLLNNAVKFTDTGSITLRVTDIPDEDHYIRIEVEDTGIGISQEGQKKLFQKFSRVEDDQASYVSGTGLGLAISKHLVFLMNGKIDVQRKRARAQRSGLNSRIMMLVLKAKALLSIETFLLIS